MLRRENGDLRSVFREALTAGFCEAVLCELRHRFATHGTDEHLDLLDFDFVVAKAPGGRRNSWKQLGQLNCFRRFDRSVHSLLLSH